MHSREVRNRSPYQHLMSMVYQKSWSLLPEVYFLPFPIGSFRHPQRPSVLLRLKSQFPVCIRGLIVHDRNRLSVRVPRNGVLRDISRRKSQCQNLVRQSMHRYQVLLRAHHYQHRRPGNYLLHCRLFDHHLCPKWPRSITVRTLCCARRCCQRLCPLRSIYTS